MLTHKIEDKRSRVNSGQMLTHEFEDKRSRVNSGQMLTQEFEDKRSRVNSGQMLTHEIKDKRSRVNIGQTLARKTMTIAHARNYLREILKYLRKCRTMRSTGPAMLVTKLAEQALRPKRIASLALPMATLGGPVTAGVIFLVIIQYLTYAHYCPGISSCILIRNNNMENL